MAATIIISVLVLGYAVWVVRRKIRDMRAGKFCSCGCNSCTHSCKVEGERGDRKS